MPVHGAHSSGDDVVAWLDVTAGVAGDMLLGALLDAGADLGEVQRMVDLVLPDAVRLEVAEVQRAGIRAAKVEVHALVADHHRHWGEIRGRIARVSLPEPVTRNATRVFARLAQVEARIHAVPLEDVEFHEVGSWDSIADVVGCCAALHVLRVSEVVASPIALGSGTVRAVHGQLPVPVPAVLALVDGWSVVSGGQGELATPTGAALVTTLADSQGDLPAVTVLGSGVGAGSRDTADRPNVVRVVLGRRTTSAQPTARDGAREPMAVLEANIDDLDPRVWPTVLCGLIDAGAADAWLVPTVMKKGRPAHTLTVLCHPDDAPSLRERMLDLTSTLGVRQMTTERWALDRGWADVSVDGQHVAVKVGHRRGEIVHATPEFEDVATAARALGRPVRDVLSAASAAAAAAHLTRGRAVPAGLRATHTAASAD